MQTHSVLLRIVALSLLLYSLYLFGASLSELTGSEQVLSEKKVSLSVLREENFSLREKLSSVENGEGMEELARQRLGLVMPGERIFYFTNEDAD